MIGAGLQDDETIGDGLPDGRAGLSGKHVYLSIISTKFIVSEDEVIGNGKMQVPVLEGQGCQLMDETFDEVVGQFEWKLEVNRHEQEIYFLLILLKEFIEESHELVTRIEGVIEVILRSSITSHRQAANIFCEMGWAETGVISIPGRVLDAGDIIRQGKIELEVLHSF